MKIVVMSADQPIWLLLLTEEACHDSVKTSFVHELGEDSGVQDVQDRRLVTQSDLPITNHAIIPGTRMLHVARLMSGQNRM